MLPFFVEDQLRKNGALAINKDNIADKHEVIRDARIVSTIFLPPAALVAKEMLILLEQGEMLNKSTQPAAHASTKALERVKL